MITNRVSIRRVFDNINTIFKIKDDSWLDDSVIYIGRALEIIGVSQVFKKIVVTKSISSGRVQLPCNLKSLIMIIVDGIEYHVTENSQVIHPTNKEHLPEYSVGVNENYLFFKQDTGSVDLYYYALSVDEEGLPTIPDNPFVFQAIEWFVISQLLLSGYKHQTITYADAEVRWEKFYPQAQNSLKSLGELELSKFYDLWTASNIASTIKINYYNE